MDDEAKKNVPLTLVRVPLAENSTGQGLLLTTLAMLCLGVVMVHSALASVARPGEWYQRQDYRDTAFAFVAAIVLMTAWRMNYRWFFGKGRWPWAATALLLIAIACGCLVFVPGIGYSVGGRYRWIYIGPRQFHIGFEPSEIIKFSLVILLSAWLTRASIHIRSFWKTFLPALALIGACVGLIITQDFGTGMLIVVSSGVTLLLAGVPWYYIFSLVPLSGVGAYFCVFLKPQYWDRVRMWWDSSAADNPAAYQAHQSILAVMSGGWWGQGLGNGKIKLGYLPEDATDFIFSVFCEEWGFIGATLLLGLILLWIYLALRAASRSQDPFGRVLAGSLGFLIAIQAVLHVGVDLVVLPTKGLGLPFISAGGTSLVIMAAAAAVLVSVTSRRKQPLDGG